MRTSERQKSRNLKYELNSKEIADDRKGNTSNSNIRKKRDRTSPHMTKNKSKNITSVKKSSNSSTSTNHKSSIIYINASDRPYFIFFMYSITFVIVSINLLYQYKFSKKGLFHDKFSFYILSKYFFCTLLPLLLVSVWLSTILTKLRNVLKAISLFIFRNIILRLLKPEIIVSVLIIFLSYRVVLFIPVIFKYIHSLAEFFPVGGNLISLLIIIMFTFFVFFLILWMSLLFAYDISDSIVKTTKKFFSSLFNLLKPNKSSKQTNSK